MSFVVLPEHHVGFMYDRSPTMFAVMNVINGDLWTYPVPEDRFPKRPVCFGKPFLPAGNNAEWVAYYANDTKLVLFDWRSGEVHQEIETSRTVRYVMAECPLIDANCLVGFVHVREKGPEKTAVMKCFDGEDDAFSIDSDSKLFMLLRSADKQTYVLITSSGPGYGEGMYFQVRRNTKGEPKCWGGELDMPGYPEIRDNGSVLACRCEPYPHSQFVCTELWGWQLWIEIDNAASSKVARIPLFITPEALVWTQRTKDSGLAVFAESGCFLVLTKYCNDGGSFTPVQLRRWFVNDMISVHVVADHYIVVQSRDGKITIIHFDWFCEGATGVYACPGFVEEETDEFSGSGMDLIY